MMDANRGVVAASVRGQPVSGDLLASGSAAGWRAPVLRHFTAEIAAATRLTIVGDPDQLLTEQVMLGELRARGFDLVPFDDQVAFRFAYESRYRQIWDRGERTNLVVVLRSDSGDLDALPYDLLERARHQDRCLSFSVGELFPRLAPTVVLGLDRGHFDALFAAQTVDDSVRLGVDATRDFVLRHAFQIVPELIRTPAGLLQVLLRRHYRGLAFPPDLDQRFMRHLKASGRWTDWPLDEIVPNSGAFLTFLEERWPRFVKRAIEPRNDSVVESAAVYDLRFAGPVDLPFGHDDVKVYIYNLFQEGRLAPARGYRVAQVPEWWMRVGVAGAEGEDRAVRFERLLKRLETEFPREMPITGTGSATPGPGRSRRLFTGSWWKPVSMRPLACRSVCTNASRRASPSGCTGTMRRSTISRPSYGRPWCITSPGTWRMSSFGPVHNPATAGLSLGMPWWSWTVWPSTSG